MPKVHSGVFHEVVQGSLGFAVRLRAADLGFGLPETSWVAPWRTAIF